MTYSFRLRVDRSPTDTINVEEEEYAISSNEDNITVSLRSGEKNKILKDSNKFALIGSGYNSKDDADKDGIKYQTALMLAFARIGLGADFGQRALKSVFTEHGIKWAEEHFGAPRVLNDVHGLMVYPSEPKPGFISQVVNLLRQANPEAFRKEMDKALEVEVDLTEKELLAFTLFNASFFQHNADSRFLLLVMAVEALVEPTPRSDDAIELVNQLIDQAKNSALQTKERDSIVSKLRELRNESISQAARHLVTTRLGVEKQYGELTPGSFFTECYRVRSRMVHGGTPYPTIEEVGALTAPLETFVSDLLTVPYLGHKE